MLKSYSYLVLISCLMVACSNGEDKTPLSCQSDIHGLFVDVPSGTFIDNLSPQLPEEGEAREVFVEGFSIMAHEVTNIQFREFVEATGYVTDAERNTFRADAGSALFVDPDADGSGSWKLDASANWRKPEGKGSDLDGREFYPVVHVSHNDALAYANWAGARLPSEIEWEYVARIGLEKADDSISSAYNSSGEPIANTWQGLFPVFNTAEDGFAGLAPIGCFGPNKAGVYDFIGNVWEWTASPFSTRNQDSYTIKGGSYLCAKNFCQRYRPEARQPHERDFSTNHIGFRVVKSLN